jgi:imidazolonepropionase-like amidohydrolase
VGDGKVVENGVVRITGTRVTSVGGASERAGLGGDVKVIDVSGKIVTPGLIGADTYLGLIEVGAESSTRDSGRQSDHPIRAAYDVSLAINAESSLIQVNAVEGVTSAVVSPSGGLVAGRAAFIDLVHGDHTGIVSVPRLSVRASLGQAYAGSRAATLAKLREVLSDARFYRGNRGAVQRRQARQLSAHPLDLEALFPVLTREVPLVLSANRASDLLAAVQLATDENVRIVLLGADQGHKVADALAKAGVPVIVQPSRNLPRSFDSLGASLENAARLHRAGVEVGLAELGESHNVRNMTQEAGLAVANGFPAEAAIGAMTRTIARAFGVDRDYGTLEAGKVANVVVWSGDPLELSEWPEQVFIRGRAIPMRSRQTELRDRYMDLSRFRP